MIAFHSNAAFLKREEDRFLDRVVHVVFDRMRRHARSAIGLGHLQLDVGVDHVVGEDAAGLEEVAVLVEALERFAQAAAHGRDLASAPPAAGRRGSCPSAVAGMDLVLDAVEAGHQHGGEAEVGVRRRIGEADLDALGLRAGHYGMRHDAERLRAE